MTNDVIKVRSLKLLEMISANNGMPALANIAEDEHDPRPVYYFYVTNNVMSALVKFKAEYAADDRSMDNWSMFDPQEFYNADSDNCVITRNIRIVNSILKAGYAMNLCAAYKEQKGNKTAYKFLPIRKLAKLNPMEMQNHLDIIKKN